MPVGVRIGPREGARVGPRIGSAPAGAVQTTMTASLADSVATVINGKNFDITLVVTNTGGVDATSVTAVVDLDANLTYVSGSGTGWGVSESGGNVTCTRATMVPGAAPTITITVTAANTADVTASTTVLVTAANAPNANDTETTTLQFVTRDSTSSIYTPTSSTQWTNFINYNALSIAVPNSLWLCNEASGNLADSIGSLSLTATGLAYQQSVGGMARLGVAFDQGSSDRATVGAGSGPNPNTTSQTWLCLADITGVGASTRTILKTGSNATVAAGLVTSAPVSSVTCVAVATNGTGDPVTGNVRPHALIYDRTGSRVQYATDIEIITGTYSALVLDGPKGFGSDTGAAGVSPAMVIPYGCMWSGANGEISQANLKALLQAMGITIPW